MRRSYGSKSDSEAVGGSRQRAANGRTRRQSIQFKPGKVTSKLSSTRTSLPLFSDVRPTSRPSAEASSTSLRPPIGNRTSAFGSLNNQERYTGIYGNRSTGKSSSLGLSESEQSDNDGPTPNALHLPRSIFRSDGPSSRKHPTKSTNPFQGISAAHSHSGGARFSSFHRKRPLEDLSDDEDDEEMDVTLINGLATNDPSSSPIPVSPAVASNAGKLVDLELLKANLMTVSKFKSDGTLKSFNQLRSSGSEHIFKAASDLASFVTDTVSRHRNSFEFAFTQGCRTKAELHQDITAELDLFEERLVACNTKFQQNVEKYKTLKGQRDVQINETANQFKAARKEHEKVIGELHTTWIELQAGQTTKIETVSSDKAGNKDRMKQLSLLLSAK